MSVSVKKRNYGIDLLRIVSMLMVITLHVLGHGGILEANTYLSVNYEIAWFIETMAYCAINCFVIMTGYVNNENKVKFSNIFKLWIQVWFYSIVLTVVIGAIVPNSIDVMTVIKAFLPITFEQYWFFTSYVGLYLFMPLLNEAIQRIEIKSLSQILGVLFVGLSVYPTIVHADVFKENWGYSTIWFVFLYVVGAYLKKNATFLIMKNSRYCMIYLAMIVISWLAKYCAEYGYYKLTSGIINGNLLINYISPTILVAAVVLVRLFSELQFNSLLLKITVFLSPAAFGTYLIHDHPLVRKYVISDLFCEFASFSPIKLIVSILGSVIVIYVICSCIDLLRNKLFSILKPKIQQIFKVRD